MTDKKSTQQLGVRIPDSLEPVYANLIKISHADDEVTLTFLHKIPETNLAQGRAIVTITPRHAKRLLRALSTNLKRYEATYGEIKLPEDGSGREEKSNVEVA